MEPRSTILITGADRGLGFALAKRFLAAGYHVFAGKYAEEAPFPEVLTEGEGRLTPVVLDVSHMGSIQQAVRQVQAHTGQLDILINNAGIHLEKEATPLEDLNFTDGHLETSMAVNTFGPLRMVQQTLSLLEAGQRKLIVNISSEAGSIGSCWRDREFAYSMSKAALNMQSLLLQRYLWERGFKVLAVHPGWMRTDMGGSEADLHPDESADAIYQLTRRNWTALDPVYLDYRGNPLPW